MGGLIAVCICLLIFPDMPTWLTVIVALVGFYLLG